MGAESSLCTLAGVHTGSEYGNPCPQRPSSSVVRCCAPHTRRGLNTPETAQIIEHLIALAKEMQAAQERGEQLGLTTEEIAVAANESAVQVLGDATLHQIARELVETVKRNTTIDWTLKESVRARLRVLVRRTLRKWGYPPDQQEEATKTVLEQAELLSELWVA